MLRSLPRLVVIAVLLVAAPLVSLGQRAPSTLTGKVIGVTDGDTLTLLLDKTTVRIRLEGIDAPEGGQAFGTQAKKALSDKVFGKQVTVKESGKDRYDRTLGHVYVGDQHVNRELLTEGFAWHYKEFNRDPDLAAAENEARQARRGLWRDDTPTPPWDFRHLPKAAAATPAKPPAKAPAKVSRPPATRSASVTVYVTDTGDKYHLDGCRSLAKSKHPISLTNAKDAGYGACKLCSPPP